MRGMNNGSISSRIETFKMRKLGSYGSNQDFISISKPKNRNKRSGAKSNS
jgi:hypothetical protein